MASVTTWTRLEPLPRTSDLSAALEARIADPLWMLARQWQTLEFQGEDAGSPIVAQLEAEHARLSRYHAGSPGRGAADRAVDYDGMRMPLEAMVEREPSGIGEVERLRAGAGLQFLRLLTEHRAVRHRTKYVDLFAFAPGDSNDGSDADAFRAVAGGRVPDGAALYANLTAQRGSEAELTSLPTEPAIPSNDHPKVLAAANEWIAWYEALFIEPDDRLAWNPQRMEYRFAVSADTGSGRVVLHADEYAEGRLDWWAFTADTGPSLGDPSEPAPPERIVRTVIPTPVAYAGMPADRFWQFEDGRVSFGSLDAGPADITRLTLVEFALVYGNDWFVAPLDLPVGSLCSVGPFSVTDTFGVTTRVSAVSEPAPGRWSMFSLSAPDGSSAGQRFFLPPTLPMTLESGPIEEVALMRDEMANMVWGVERIVQGVSGDPIDRRQAQAIPTPGLQQVDGGVEDVEIVYRLATPVPEHWIPFVPVAARGASAGQGEVQFERRSIRRHTQQGVRRIEPTGEVLLPGRVLRIEEEEVPRAGILVTRSYQYTRWLDGRGHLWLGRRKRVGRGEGSSGLRFDVLEPPD
ncbi:MAG: hypothetical protein ABFR53_02080 [Actinomycetota bacterium]